MELLIRIESDNDAFADGECNAETARILRTLADRIEAGGAVDMTSVHNVNGNNVGTIDYDDGQEG